MTVSVPPSAARVAKLSAERAAKLAAKTAPLAVDDTITSQKPSVDQIPQQQQQQDEDSPTANKQQRWYMGQYGVVDGKIIVMLLCQCSVHNFYFISFILFNAFKRSGVKWLLRFIVSRVILV